MMPQGQVTVAKTHHANCLFHVGFVGEFWKRTLHLHLIPFLQSKISKRRVTAWSLMVVNMMHTTTAWSLAAADTMQTDLRL